MATTRLIPLHVGKGKTIASALGRTVDYVENPDKTEGGELVTAYQCDPLIAEQEFLFAKSQYTATTGRSQGDKDVIAYHLRQAFHPNEVTPEQANQIGYDLAMSLTKGRHAFLVCTHVDREHIHSHIIFNSTTLDCSKKFRNFWGSSLAIRRISDRLCLENGLSIIENPAKSSGHYRGNKSTSHSDILRQTIDQVLARKPANFDQFVAVMQDKGYEVKQGKHLAFKGGNQKKFIRLQSLGEGYSETEIRAIIEGKTAHKLRTPKPEKQFNLLIDIQSKLQEGKGAGYENWAKKFNMKQMSKTLNYLTENHLLSYDKLDAKTEAVSEKFHQTVAKMKSLEAQMADINDLKKHIINYHRSKELYKQYHKSGYSKKFFEEHRAELTLHRAARDYFDSKGLKKLPSAKGLQEEYLRLSHEKKNLYGDYQAMKKEHQELQIAKANIDEILGRTQKNRNQNHSQTR